MQILCEEKLNIYLKVSNFSWYYLNKCLFKLKFINIYLQ